VSHHLKVLREAGLIEGEKRRSWVWYRPVPAALDDLRTTLAADAVQPA
jgi:ArsR family transcriptional regulator, arsenate/arsenite/antimonite-responsive transcriptional repressor